MESCSLGREEAEQAGGRAKGSVAVLSRALGAKALLRCLRFKTPRKKKSDYCTWSDVRAGLMSLGQQVQAGADIGCWEGGKGKELS